MDEIIKVIPPKDEGLRRFGLYRIIFKTKDGEEYNADVTRKQFHKIQIKKTLLQMGVNKELLQQYEDAIIEEKDESDSF